MVSVDLTFGFNNLIFPLVGQTVVELGLGEGGGKIALALFKEFRGGDIGARNFKGFHHHGFGGVIQRGLGFAGGVTTVGFLFHFRENGFLVFKVNGGQDGQDSRQSVLSHSENLSGFREFSFSYLHPYYSTGFAFCQGVC